MTEENKCFALLVKKKKKNQTTFAFTGKLSEIQEYLYMCGEILYIRQRGCVINFYDVFSNIQFFPIVFFKHF